MLETSAALKTSVYHKRHTPRIHEFTHNVLYLYLNLNQISGLKTKFFSINRRNLISVFWKNYGFKPFENPIIYVKNTLEKFNINTKVVDNIALLTMPKILGYVFNPVSFWLCFNKNKDLLAVLVEVNNTFGERHAYLCFQQNLKPITKTDLITKEKIFHVSPFCDVEGNYEFCFDVNSNNINININYFCKNEILISTAIKGKKFELNDLNLIKQSVKFPVMVFKVIILIHYHAIRLWLKKVPYFKKPEKPKLDIT